jgi:hypothetical protein
MPQRGLPLRQEPWKSSSISFLSSSLSELSLKAVLSIGNTTCTGVIAPFRHSA